MNRTVVAICLAIAPLVAFATIYKVRMPDGTIMFTDSPPAGAKILEERQPLPPPATPAPAPRATPPRAADKAVSAPGSGSATTQGAQGVDAAIAEVSEAEREFAAAKRRLETGREPLPGERLGTVSGRSRLSPEYENRIAGLEREVAAAEARVKRAYEARNALR